MTRRRALWFSLGVVAILALIRSAAVPAWYGDAQYYLQAGRLWRQGTVTFAGHLIADRHIAVGYYQAFQSLLGPSADSAAIALAVAFLAAGGLVVTLCFAVSGAVWRPAVTSIILVAVLSLIPIWNSMLTDPLLLVASLLVLNAVARLPRQRTPWPLLAGIGAICGFGYGIRPETVVMLLAVVLARLVTSWRGVSIWGREIAVTVLAFAVGYGAQSTAWYAWVPAPKPQTYSAAFAFYLPMYYHGEAEDGPASAAIARMEESAGLPLTTDYIGLFPVMAAGAKAHAVKETDRLVARAGLELLEAKPRRLLNMFAREGGSYLTQPALALERDTFSWDARWGFMRDRLRALDARREETSAGFGNDAWWKTETVGDRHVAAVVGLRSLLPSWSFVLRLPGFLLLAGLGAALVAVVFRRQHAAPVLAASLFVIGAFVITNFSQGFDPRYSEIWRYLSVVMIALTSLTWPPISSSP